MRNPYLVLAFLILTVKPVLGDLFRENITTVGPGIHFNFGNHLKSTNISFSLELAIWDHNNEVLGDFGYGYNFGMEIAKDLNYLFVYTEFQLGAGVIGTSIGPFYNIKRNKIGFQSTTWAGFIALASVRFRPLNPSSHSYIGFLRYIEPDVMKSN